MKKLFCASLVTAIFALASCGGSNSSGAITPSAVSTSAWYGQCHAAGSDSSAECFKFTSTGQVAVKILSFNAVTDCSNTASVATDSGTVTFGDVLSDGSTALDVALTGTTFYTRMKFTSATNDQFNVGKQTGAADDGSSAAKRFLGLATNYAFVKQATTIVDCAAFDDTLFP